MPDESHADILANPPPLRLPPARTTVPLVVAPTCGRDCSGRHETDGVLRCGTCGGTKYRVVLHEWRHAEGHYFNGLEPMNGAPPYDGRDPVCCGTPMQRVFK